MSKENLDNFFQQKANQRSFEFEDDYWKEMELLLEDEEDNKTPLPFWWQNGRLLLGSLIAIIAIGALYMMLKPNSNQTNSETQEISIQNQTNSSLSTEATENTATLSTNNSNIPNEGESPAPLSSNDRKNSNTLNNNSSNTNSSTTSTNRSGDDLNKNNGKRSMINSHQRNSVDKNNRPNSINPRGLAIQKNTTDNNRNSTSNNTSSNPSDDVSNIANGNNGKSIKDEKPIVTLNRDAEKTLSEKTKFNFLDLIALSEIDAILKSLKTKLPKSVKPIKPTSPNKLKPSSSGDLITIGIHAGASRYFYDTDIQNEQPYSTLAGVYANFPLSKKLSLGVGLNYWARGNINAALISDSTIYNFGFQQITTTDFVSRATYLEIPLSLKYRIREKHIAEIGGNFSYLLTARGSRSVTMSDDFGTTDLSSNVTNGYKNWLNTYDAALRLGYHYQWNERGTVGLQWQYGLTDVTPDNIYNNTIFDRNHQFRIIVGYDLIRIQPNKKKK